MKIKEYLLSTFLFLILILMCLKPEAVKGGAINGINLSLNVLIPSIFPFLFVVNLLSLNINKINIPLLYFLSIIGGYPVGAKLIENLYINSRIDKKTANIMQCFCVNAGPGFIISSVGYGIFGNKIIGLILFISHLLSSSILMMFSLFKIKKFNDVKNESKLNFSNKVVISVMDASKSTLTICSFVIVFSVVTSFLKKYKYICLLLEISNSVKIADDIYVISFLLGFSCLCVIMQIIAISEKSGINFINFLISRLIHGLLSSFFTYLIVIIFNINIKTSTKQIVFTHNGLFLGISIFIMAVSLVVELSNKKYSGNLLKNIV